MGYSDGGGFVRVALWWCGSQWQPPTGGLVYRRCLCLASINSFGISGFGINGFGINGVRACSPGQLAGEGFCWRSILMVWLARRIIMAGWRWAIWLVSNTRVGWRILVRRHCRDWRKCACWYSLVFRKAGYRLSLGQT